MPIHIFTSSDGSLVGRTNGPDSPETVRNRGVKYQRLATEDGAARFEAMALITLFAGGVILSLGLIWVGLGFIPGAYAHPAVFGINSLLFLGLVCAGLGLIPGAYTYIREIPTILCTGRKQVSRYGPERRQVRVPPSAPAKPAPRPMVAALPPDVRTLRKQFNEPFYDNITPEEPPVEGFIPFQLDCTGGEIPLHRGFGYYEGPAIARYEAGQSHFGTILARIRLTPEMAQRLPYFPEGIIDGKPISHAYVTIWGNMPKADDSLGAGSEHLMFQPHTLLVRPDPGCKDEKERMAKCRGYFPADIGFFTSADGGGIIEVERSTDSQYETGIPVNLNLARCQYDSHGDGTGLDDQPGHGFFTSSMGTFDLDWERSAHAFTAIVTLPESPKYSEFEDKKDAMVFYQLFLSDDLARRVAPAIRDARDLPELLDGLQDIDSSLPPGQIADLRKVFF